MAAARPADEVWEVHSLEEQGNAQSQMDVCQVCKGRHANVLRRPLVMFNYHTLRRYSGKPSGISKYMFGLLRALIDRDRMDFALCTSWDPEQLPSDIRSRLKFVEHRTPIRPRILDVFVQGSILPQIAREKSVDVILNVDPLGTPRGAACRVSVVHDLYFRAFPEAVRLHERLFYSVIVNAVLGGSDRIVCVSDTTKSDLLRFFPKFAKKAVRIYEDAALVDESPDPGQAGEPYFLFVGNLVKAKNVEALYRALELLARSGHTPRTVVVGRDPDGLARDAAALLDRARTPERLENVSDATLASLFRGALSLVNTSLYEGFCLPVVEAQRMGVPVICSGEAAVGEIAGEGALLIDPRDPDSIADAMRLVLTQPELRSELVARGRTNADRFSWAEAARQFEDLIGGLLDERSSAPRARGAV